MLKWKYKKRGARFKARGRLKSHSEAAVFGYSEDRDSGGSDCNRKEGSTSKDHDCDENSAAQVRDSRLYTSNAREAWEFRMAISAHLILRPSLGIVWEFVT